MAPSKTKAKAASKPAKKSTGELAAPKGMRDLIGEEYYLFQGFFEKAQEVAVYYGFKPMLTIINESGAPSTSIDLNSIGCKDCRPHYVRELVAYYKKHLNALPSVDRERLKTNPLRILDSKEAATIEINAGAPESVSYL